MPLNILFGNGIALIACIIMTVSGYFKSKQKTLFLQTIQIALNAMSCAVLNSYSGTIINILSVPRNILAYKNRLTLPVKISMSVFMASLSFMFNTKGIIGLLPLISTVSYTMMMDKLGDRNFKILIIFTLIWWGVHDIYVQNYVSFAFDLMTMITSGIAVFRLQRDRDCKKKEMNVDDAVGDK